MYFDHMHNLGRSLQTNMEEILVQRHAKTLDHTEKELFKKFVKTI